MTVSKKQLEEAARLAWMLIYLQSCHEYLKEHFPTAYSDCGLSQHEAELAELAPIINRLKDHNK